MPASDHAPIMETFRLVHFGDVFVRTYQRTPALRKACRARGRICMIDAALC